MKKHVLRLLALVCAMLLTLVCLSSALAEEKGLAFYEDRDGKAYASWRYLKGELRIDPHLMNNSKNYAVDGAEIAIYCMDIDHNPIYPADGEDGYIRYFSNKVNFKRNTDDMYGECSMKGCNEDTIFFGVAITRYHFKDGSVVNLVKEGETDPLDMYDWYYWDVR